MYKNLNLVSKTFHLCAEPTNPHENNIYTPGDLDDSNEKMNSHSKL